MGTETPKNIELTYDSIKFIKYPVNEKIELMYSCKPCKIVLHIKIGRSTVLKVYCRGKEASRKTPRSGSLSIFQGSVELLKNVSSKSGLGSTWLVRCENENCPLQITNEAFSTTERIEQSRAFEMNCSSVVGFRFQLFLLCHYYCPFSGILKALVL